MNNQASVTVILANRPRLFRELLQHALKTEMPHIHVIEAADGTPSASLLREANWLVIDDESAAGAGRITAANPHLGILALDTRGSSARLVAPLLSKSGQPFSDVPTLAGLFSLLSHAAIESAR